MENGKSHHKKNLNLFANIQSLTPRPKEQEQDLQQDTANNDVAKFLPAADTATVPDISSIDSEVNHEKPQEIVKVSKVVLPSSSLRKTHASSSSSSSRAPNISDLLISYGKPPSVSAPPEVEKPVVPAPTWQSNVVVFDVFTAGIAH